MPILLILAIIAGAIAGVLYLAAAGLKSSGSATVGEVVGTKIAGHIALGIAILFTVLSCFTVVSTKQVGVVTTFGAPQGTLSNGLHLKFPWQKVTELDAAIQTDTDEYGVRLANQYRATVESTVRWRIVPDAADDLFRDYRTFENIRDSLVTKQLNAAENEVFAGYDPLKSLSTEPDPAIVEQSGELGEQVKAVLQEKVGDQIEILDVLTPRPDYDTATEEKISQYQQAIADTRIAEQRKKTATAEAAANRILRNSVSNDPNVLVSKCIDAINTMVKSGQPVPAGFSCWPGGGSAVVVPSK